MNEPFLPAHLEDDTTPSDWHECALLALAEQLGVMNDFYYPLLGAVECIYAGRKLAEAVNGLKIAADNCDKTFGNKKALTQEKV